MFLFIYSFGFVCFSGDYGKIESHLRTQKDSTCSEIHRTKRQWDNRVEDDKTGSKWTRFGKVEGR